ncbi:MAG: O-antigen ligase family protein, partial [Acidobacteriota bacterium]
KAFDNVLSFGLSRVPFMNRFLGWLDLMVQPPQDSFAARWLERVAFLFLFLMFAAAPNSIAATQIAWMTGMVIWLVRLLFKPSVKFRFSWIDVALVGLFVWSVISGIFSYDPPTSLNRLRVVALFLIFYFVFYNIRNLRAAYFLASILILSCMVNVAWTPFQRWIGRGVEIHGLRPDGPLAKAGLIDGDTLDRANGKILKTPDDALAELSKHEITPLEFYRGDFETDSRVRQADLGSGTTSEERLGFESWRTGRIIRASGFFRHYVTYAESLQLLASLVFGLFVAAFSRKYFTWNSEADISIAGSKFPAWIVFLAAFACMGAVLFLTITRASQAALMISAFAILLVSRNRKLALAAIAVAIPVAIGGLIYLQLQRHVGFFDAQDGSTRYRQVMWADGVRLWLTSPRNFFLGIGMDSIKAHWQEWNMFDGGRLPVSHFHSNPIQLLVERGLPALLLWISAMFFYFKTLVRGIRSQLSEKGDWRTLGIILGCFGGAIGFLVSGFTQYNLGDSVVAMLFFLLMGLGMRTAVLALSADLAPMSAEDPT